MGDAFDTDAGQALPKPRDQVLAIPPDSGRQTSDVERQNGIHATPFRLPFQSIIAFSRYSVMRFRKCSVSNWRA